MTPGRGAGVLLVGAALWCAGAAVWVAVYLEEAAALVPFSVPLLLVLATRSALRRGRRWLAWLLVALLLALSLFTALVGGLVFVPAGFLLAVATAISPPGSARRPRPSPRR